MVIATGLDNNALPHSGHFAAYQAVYQEHHTEGHSRNQVEILQGSESRVQSHVASSNP